MTEYFFGVKCEKGLRWKPYIAKIQGRDPNFILRRSFQEVKYTRTEKGGYCWTELQNGLYEVAINRTDKKTGERVWRERWWIIVIDDEIYEYEFDEMNWQYALYAAFLVRTNCGMAESA